jgi:nicotinamide-nucleotide amidase
VTEASAFVDWLAAPPGTGFAAARLRGLLALAGYRLAGTGEGASVRIVAGEPDPRGEAVAMAGHTAATWRDWGGTLDIRVVLPELAVPAAVAALAAGGRDPRSEGRYAAAAPDAATLRARLPASAAVRPVLPGEFLVDGAPGAQDPWLDAGLRPPEAVVGQRLEGAGCKVATTESCTGGLIAERLTAVPGSSAYVDRGWVTYTNAAKMAELGVAEATLHAHGAVSEPVAAEMAAGARAASQADVAVAVTGVAGPSGGTPDKPVGTVCFGVAAAGSPPGRASRTVRYQFSGGRADVRWASANTALALILDALEGV